MFLNVEDTRRAISCRASLPTVLRRNFHHPLFLDFSLGYGHFNARSPGLSIGFAVLKSTIQLFCTNTISSKMEALAAMRLSLSPRRYRPNSDKYCEDESAPSSPCYLSAPSSPYYLSVPNSPRPSALREVEETPLGEVLAAIPFEWELTPGTPKKRNKYGDLIDEDEDPSPSPMRLSRQSSAASEFDFSSTRFLAIEDTTHKLSSDVPIASADQLFFHGQILPLRLPPRLQAVKQFGESDETVMHGSFRGMPVSPRSGICAMSFRATSKSPQREVRFEEEVEFRPKSAKKLQKFRSLSPLRIFKRENSEEVSIFFSEKSTSGSDSASSSSSAFSSSSSGDEKSSNITTTKELWPFFEEDECKSRSTLNDFLYSDKPPASPKIDLSKLSSKEVLCKADGLKAPEKGLKSVPSKELKAKALTPQLSRSNARSISRTPLVASPVTTRTKQRVIASNPIRFGFLKQCLGGF